MAAKKWKLFVDNGYAARKDELFGFRVGKTKQAWNGGRYATQVVPTPPGPCWEASDWTGTIQYVSSAYGASGTRIRWKIIDHPDQSLVGYNFTSNLEVLLDEINSGDLPLVKGTFRWKMSGSRLGIDKL